MECHKIDRSDLECLIQQRISLPSVRGVDRNHDPFACTVSELFDYTWQLEQLILEWAQEVSGRKKVDSVQEWNRIEVLTSLTHYLSAINEYEIFIFSVTEEIKEYIIAAQSWQQVPNEVAHQFISKFLISLASDVNANSQSPTGYSNQQVIGKFSDVVKQGIQQNNNIKEYLSIGAAERYAQRSFGEMLTKYKKIQVICVDIEFVNYSSNNYAQFVLTMIAEIPSLINIILEISDQILDLHTALLPNSAYGFNLQCVFILDASKTQIQEESFLAQLDCLFVGNLTLLLYGLKLINWNNVIRQKYAQKGVGIISASDVQAIAECKYWVISPVYSYGQFFEFYLGNNYNGGLKVEGSHRDRLKEIREARKNQEKYQKDMEKLNKLAIKPPLQASKKIAHLEKSKPYLDAASLIYAEYDHNFKVSNQLNLFEGKLYQIEVFMETLKTSKAELIRLPQHARPVELTGNSLYSYFTKLGRLWHEIFHIGSSWYSFFLDAKLPLASSNITIFQKFLADNKHELEVNQGNGLGLKSVQGENGEQILSLQSLIANLKIILPNKPSYQQEFAKIERRLKGHKNYLHGALQGDEIIYRADLSGSSGNNLLNQNELSKLFTDFLRHGKQNKPLCWLRGYVMRWDQRLNSDAKVCNYGDITFIFEQNEKNYNLNIMSMLQEYLLVFIEKRNAKEEARTEADTEKERIEADTEKAETMYDSADSKHKRSNTLSIELQTKTIWSSIDQLNFDILVLEKEKVSTRKILLEKYLPALEYLDLFIPIEPQPKKRCTTGSSLKEKEAKSEGVKITSKKDGTA